MKNEIEFTLSFRNLMHLGHRMRTYLHHCYYMCVPLLSVDYEEGILDFKMAANLLYCYKKALLSLG